MKKPLQRSVLILMRCILYLQAFAFMPADTTSANAGSVDGHRRPQSVYRDFGTLMTPLPGRAASVFSSDHFSVADTVLRQREYAHRLLQTVLSAQRFLESLDALSETDLPVGVVRSGGAVDYTILIDRIAFSKEGATMDVYVSLELPQARSRIAFHGVVPLSAQGGIAGNAKIFLLGDHRLQINDDLLVTIRGTEASYVEFDCTGFLGVNLDAELEFSSDMIVPENEDGQPGGGRVKAHFTTYTQSVHDILLKVTVPPFQIRGLKGFGFYAEEAYLDWSDLSNPQDMRFPDDYLSPVIEAGLPKLWQGIYLKGLGVRLPPAFAKRSAATRVTAGMHDVLIDDLGFTGDLFVENLLADGDMNGWPYTIDRLALAVSQNQVTGFTLEGSLSIPVVKNVEGKPAKFGYTAQRSADGDYIFSVAVEDALKLDLWAADLKLHAGSSVVVTEKDKTFRPSARLNGELTINVIGKGPKAAFNSIRFEDMVISSDAPHFKPGTFGFGREGDRSAISGFPVVVDKISVRSDDQRAGLAFDLRINITGKPGEDSFAAKAGLIVWGKHEESPVHNAQGTGNGMDDDSWQFDKIELTRAHISIRKPGVIELTGDIRFFDEDGTYGDGFKGALKGKIHSITVQAEALFGRNETFRYWYADALVELKSGIPLVPGALSAFGFGGGYYSKMKQSDQRVYTTLGKTPSGITYVPDEETVGVRAIVLIGTPRPEAMRGDVALEVSINRHGGINSVTFTGNAYFMSVAPSGAKQIKALASAAVAGKLTEKLSTLATGQVYGSVRLHFDNVNDIFHGNLEIYVNVAGGLVRGVSEGNKAGWAVLHFGKQDWYIHIGTPDQPLGLEVARIFKSKSYFMLGKNLPGSPPPPSQVSEILGDVDLDYMRDLNALESGMGIAFGLHFLVDTGDLRFLMFYGRFSAGTGLDFMLKDYGNEYHCAGSSGPIGINGWYANGQAYAFVMGKIGVKVNLRFYKGTYDILNIGAAAILQAKGPNPFWMKGTVGGYYKILGGLIKGRCRFDVTVGEDCRPVGNEDLLKDVAMIAGISPADGAAEISVFNAPQVAFNIPVGEVFEIKDMEQKVHYFRAVLDEFSILNDGRPLSGDLVWNSEQDVVIFDAADVLPGKKKLKAKAKLTFEEKVNGLWTKVRMNGTIVEERAETAFLTGAAPDYIPTENVAISYPLLNQQHFHPKEFPQGFIQLHNGQPYLFRPDKEWIQKVRISDAVSGKSFYSDLSYNSATRLVTFSLPWDLPNSTTCQLEIINIPRTAMTVDGNVTKREEDLRVNEAAGTATLRTATIEGDLKKLEARAIYTATFRTSRYDTFIDKMQQMTISGTVRTSTGMNIFRLAAWLEGDESFSPAEISRPKSLVVLEAILQSNTWYENRVHPLVYDGYPLMGWMRVTRSDTGYPGLPPVRDVYFAQPAGIAGQNFNPAENTQLSATQLIYNLGPTVAADFSDLQRQAVNYIADDPSRITPRLAMFVTDPLPHIRYGKYRVRISYVIPCIQKTSSSYDVEIFNPIPDND